MGQVSFKGTPRFRVVRTLGEGGMGVVYEAIDDERGGRVALKTVRDMTPESLARFKREFRALQDVHHPNLIALGELISEGGQWFYTMELIDGDDFLAFVRPKRRPPALALVEGLRAPPAGTEPDSMALAATAPFVRQPGQGADASTAPPFDEARLRSALPQLVLALEAMHATGVVHRDIKPSNVRVTSEGRVVLLDFGLVADFSSDRFATETRMAGTPAYMAPEQAAGTGVGPETDWYAVGCLLYEALTGKVPFSGAPLQIMLAKQQHEPKPPSCRVKELPDDLDELCVRLLRCDRRVRATGRDIVAVLGGGEPETHALRSSSSLGQAVPFVGRDAEMKELARAFEDSLTKGAVSVHIHGESGVGKSCLVRRFAESLSTERRDVVVLSGRCYEREAVPYKAFDGVVDALARFLMKVPAADAAQLLPTKPEPLLQVFPVLRRVEAMARFHRAPGGAMDPLEIRARAFSSLRELLTRLTDRHRLIIVIDDLQWADADSFALLDALIRPPEAPHLLLVATTRGAGATNGATYTSIRELQRDAVLQESPDVRNIQLDRLRAPDAVRLAQLLLERAAPESRDKASAIAQEADGHPLFIDALVRHLAFVVVSGDARGTLRLDEALWAQIARLDAPMRLMMELVAVAGAPIAQDVLASATGAPRGDLMKRVSYLRVSQLVATTGARGNDTIDMYHDRLRSAALLALSESTKKEIHRRLAIALEQTESRDLEALATHWRCAEEPELAAKYGEMAGDQATETLAFDRAARLYTRAITLRAPKSEALRELQEKLGDALANAGRGARAAEAFQAAAASAKGAHAIELQRRAADQLLRSGRFDAGIAAVQAVLLSIGMRLPRTPLGALCQILVLRFWLRVRGMRYRERDASEIAPGELTRFDVCWSVSFSLAVADHIQGALFQAWALLLAVRSGEPTRVVRAFAMDCVYLGTRGAPGWRKTERRIAETEELARRSGAPHAIGFTTGCSGCARYLVGNFKDALQQLDVARDILAGQCTGTTWELDTVHIFGLNCLAQLGQLKELARRAETYVPEAMSRGDVYASVNLRIGLANLRWLARDKPEVAMREIGSAMEQWSNQGFHLEHFYALVAQTNVDLYRGQATSAHDRVASAWGPMRRSLLGRIQSVRILSVACRARAALASAEARGEGWEKLVALASGDAGSIARERAAWATPLADLVCAGVARLRGRRDDAVRSLRAAVAGFDGVEMAMHASAARSALAELLAAGGERETLVAAAAAWSTAQAVRRPERLFAMLAPGFSLLD